MNNHINASCRTCTHWKHSQEIIEEKFTQKGKSPCRPIMGWCGNMATSANDGCPRHEPVKQEGSA